MFDALLKSKFYAKCKSEIKLTNKRIEMIMRKRKAMQKFLKKDIADLLRNGLDSNAYGRVEGLYLEKNLSSCYEFVEKSCLLILSHLSAMNKQRECPEECREAISSLIFAAARFADLPELRDVRSLFTERYGNYLEPYVNQEFVKKLKADPPTKEMKLQLMKEVALESGIKWDSKALEQSLFKPPPCLQDWTQYAKKTSHESLKTHHQNGLETRIQETEEKHSNKQTEVTKKSHNNSLPYKSRAELEKKKEKKHNSHGSVSFNWSSSTSSSSETTSPGYSTSPDDSASEDIPEGRKSYPLRPIMPSPTSIKTDSTKKSTISDTSSTGFGGEKEVFGSKCKDGNLQNGGSKDTKEGRKMYGFRSMVPPPPYIKTDSTKKPTVSDISSGFGSKCKDGNLQTGFEDNTQEGRKLSGFRSMAPPYIKTDSAKKPTISDASSSGSNKEKVAGSKSEESVNSTTKPVPRSVRIRRALKPVHNEVSEQSPKTSNGESGDHKDEAEKKMDKLLFHYSRKESKLPADSSLVNDGCREVHGPIRAASLPHEPVTATDDRKGIARAATFQPDSGSSPRGHVHPKLPDYDDFVARLAALRANS